MSIENRSLFQKVKPPPPEQKPAPIVQDDRIPILMAQIQDLQNRLNKRPGVIATVHKDADGKLTHIILREIDNG